MPFFHLQTCFLFAAHFLYQRIFCNFIVSTIHFSEAAYLLDLIYEIQTHNLSAGILIFLLSLQFCYYLRHMLWIICHLFLMFHFLTKKHTYTFFQKTGTLYTTSLLFFTLKNRSDRFIVLFVFFVLFFVICLSSFLFRCFLISFFL